MAEHAAADDFDDDIFIYRGGRAPQHVFHVLIDKSVDEIEDHAFRFCENLLTVETHDGLRRLGKYAFHRCRSLRRINLKSAVKIDEYAFYKCENLESVEFGDRLEIIGRNVFSYCTSLELKHLRLPSILAIGISAFLECTRMTDVELSEQLERIGSSSFYGCERLQRIAIPLKRNLFEYSFQFNKYIQFVKCDQLTTVELVGQAHKQTVASLHMESWRTEMIAEINRINQVLPNTPANEKAEEIRQWMNSVIDKMDHYKAEHCRYVREGITLLELALWKAKLDEKEEHVAEVSKLDEESARRYKRMTCGADMVINNVLPFLQLE